MDKKRQLGTLKKEMEGDKNLPLRKGATQLVFGEGNPNADIYFLGEGPGYWEDQKGRPFVGQAGKLLSQLLESIGLKREEVYISNIVRFRPPENRDPTPDEIKAFEPYVDREIDIIKPKIIVTLGRISMGKFLPDVLISRVHGKPQTLSWHSHDIVVIPMYHPAAALRRGELLEQMREDFKVIPKILEEIKIEKTEQMNLI
ncbi:uracil-DNA glycosylase [Candidatus Microgenomates bacterium]|nr:uracil-DNA glycosylase [Candidatus Microgenomates bacterium]